MFTDYAIENGLCTGGRFVHRKAVYTMGTHMFFRSLRTEILFFTLGLTITTIIATTVIGINATQTAGTDAAGATGTVLRTQGRDFLTQIAKAAAAQQDLVFKQVEDNTKYVAAFTANMEDNQQSFPSGVYWIFNQRVWRTDGRYLNSEKDTSTVHIPSFVTLNADEISRIERSAYLDFLVPDIMQKNPDSAAMYTIDSQGVTRYFPNIVLGKLAPPDYDPRADIYYKPASPSENPQKKLIWSPLYNDVAGRGLMITATEPIYSKKGFFGIASTDLLLTNIIKTITSYSPIERSYAFLIDNHGETVAFPDQAYHDILGRARKEGELQTSLASTSPEFTAILRQMMSGNDGFGTLHIGDQELFIAYAPLPQTNFSMGVVAPASVVLKAVDTLHEQISGSVTNNIWSRVLPASSMIVLFASLISILLVWRIVRPIQELTVGAREIGKGNFNYNLKIQSKNEIGELAASFSQMNQDLKKSREDLYAYSRGLEAKVQERTQEISQINVQQENLLHFISHEIKGYLAKSEAAFAAIIEGDFGEVTPPLKQMAIMALAEMRKGVSTVMDILQASDLKKGTVTFEKHPFNLVSAVEKAVADMRKAADQKHLVLELTTPSEPLTILGDEQKITHHVIRNMIDNSIKYTPQESVRVSLIKDGTIARFKVEDTGVGITVEDMRHLFTEGGRGKDSIKINAHSTGFGLYIAKQIVDAHGGKIWADSDGAGKGSTFAVELPLA